LISTGWVVFRRAANPMINAEARRTVSLLIDTYYGDNKFISAGWRVGRRIAKSMEISLEDVDIKHRWYLFVAQ